MNHPSQRDLPGERKLSIFIWAMEPFRESKGAVRAHRQLLDAVNEMLVLKHLLGV